MSTARTGDPISAYFSGRRRGAPALPVLILTIAAAAASPAERYIDVNEIRPGQSATCLTVYEGTTVERFALRVVDVIRHYEPGHDAILVEGLDARFRHTGPVAGCSGSPVYIEGRLAGALAFAWPLSKDPLYGVTPIREMLAAAATPAATATARPGVTWDSRRPLAVTEVGTGLLDRVEASGAPADTALPCPLVVAGLGPAARPVLRAALGGRGLVPLIGGGDAGGAVDETLGLTPGATLMVPLVDGDIRMAVLGTATEVLDDRVYGFGHAFLGQGAVCLPLATGRIHAIVSNLNQSFKLGSPIRTVGALVRDTATGVVGVLGREAPTIPLSLRVDHFLGSGPVDYRCRLARHEALTPELLQAVVGGVMAGFGDLPPDHSLDYRATLRLAGGATIRWHNRSAGVGLREVLGELLGSVTLLLTNPFREVTLAAIDLAVTVTPTNAQAVITELSLARRQARPGETLRVVATLETYRAPRERVVLTLPLPEDLAPGRYEVTVAGAPGYERMLRRRAPHRLLALDLPSLVEALNEALGVDRARLYCWLELPTAGLALERQALPKLPETRALVLRSPSRSVAWTPLRPWVESSIARETVTLNSEKVSLAVR